MKAELNEMGILTIIPETKLESYALKKWGDGYRPDEYGGNYESVLKIQIIVEDKSEQGNK